MSARRLLRAGGGCRNRGRGITLVEVLVALVVLSVGMLGVAVMFVQSVRNSRSALLRTQAVNLVSDMADRIRANSNAGADYDLRSYTQAPALHDCAPTDESSGGNCSVSELAEDDLARWLAAVRNTLPPPGGDLEPASVEYEPGVPERYRITVRWREPGEEQAFSYQTDVLLMPRPPVVVASGS